MDTSLEKFITDENIKNFRKRLEAPPFDHGICPAA
jgi:hypothetical protein